MIPEVDEALRRLLQSSQLPERGVEIAFDAPTRDWAARRNTPAVDAYLYDIREDTGRRERGRIPLHDERGIVTAHRQPPRYFQLSYLVTAWTKRAEDEHRLLGAVLSCLLRVETLPLADDGPLARLGLSIPLVVAVPASDAQSAADLWSALGGDLKPSLGVTVVAPFPVVPEVPAGPPVTAGVGVSAERTDVPSGKDMPLRMRRTAR
jgi:hypothetical protein